MRLLISHLTCSSPRSRWLATESAPSIMQSIQISSAGQSQPAFLESEAKVGLTDVEKPDSLRGEKARIRNEVVCRYVGKVQLVLYPLGYHDPIAIIGLCLVEA